MVQPPPASASRPAVVIHGRPHLLAALAPGRPVLLLSAPGAAGFAGAGWWHALTARAGQPAALDCADQPGHALEALALGCALVILEPGPAWPSVAARAPPGALLPARPPALDLARPGAARRLHRWLQGDSAALIG